MLVARRFLLSGRVQRVGFRYFAAEAAAREGLDGWVKNLPDGRVEVRAEGDEDAVRRFEWSIRSGPPGARIEAVAVEDEAPSGRRSGFQIESAG